MNTLLKDPSMRRLADADPAAAPLAAHESDRAEVLLQRLQDRPRSAAARSAAARAPRSPRASRRVWTRVAAGSSAVVAAVTAGVLVTGPASAEQVLLEAAGNVTVGQVGAGEYWYQLSEIEQQQSIPYEREEWRSEDQLLLRDGFGAAYRAWEAGETEIDPQDVPVLDVTGAMTEPPSFGDGEVVTWDGLRELPTDGDVLRQVILEDLPRSGHGEDWDLWQQAIALLRDSPASTDLRRALWEVLASIPTVELLDPREDSAGRAAVAVQFDGSDRRLERTVLLFDPQAGTVLETRVYGLDDELLYRSTLLEQGVRSSAPEAEPPPCGPDSVPQRSC